MERITLHRSVPQPFRAFGGNRSTAKVRVWQDNLNPRTTITCRVSFNLANKSSCKLEAWYSN